MIKNKIKYMNELIITFALMLLGAFLFSKGPMPQLEHYHQFADDRFFWIPNCQNVITNLIFTFSSVYGLLFLDFKKMSRNEKIYLLTLIVGVFFTSLGSAYYHYNPNTQTLFWDRLPMSFGFIGFLMWLLSKTLVTKNDLKLFVVGFILSVGSVIYWAYSETIQQGDLRLYLFVQFAAILTTFLVIILYRSESYPKKSCFYMLLFYVLAKVTEILDLKIYEMTKQLTSGHALKHILAGVGIYLFFKYLPQKKSKIIN